VFFDDVARAHRQPRRRGGKGWTTANICSSSSAAPASLGQLREALQDVSDLAESEATGRAIDDPDISLRMSEIEVDIDTLEMTELRGYCRRCRPDRIRARCHRF